MSPSPAQERQVPRQNNDREDRSLSSSSSVSLPLADWVNHQASHFEFFYQLIFTFVHSTLTILLAPVLKITTRPSSSAPSSPRTHRACSMTQQSSSSLREIDPELAMPQMSQHGTSHNSSILKTQRRHPSADQPPFLNYNQQATTAAKSVRFPEPKRSRPPLGRISSSSISSSSASSASFSSSESSMSLPSTATSSSNGRGSRIAPRYTLESIRMSPSPRAHHSTYFLSD